ncbi:hypothetical protein JBF12_48650, partial [Streptomyces javensis]|nr:hypothetical protein [Streptomyces javensis]
IQWSSAPEIDVIEGSTAPLYGDSGPYVGSASQSLQTAPFDLWYLPDYGEFSFLFFSPDIFTILDTH